MVSLTSTLSALKTKVVPFDHVLIGRLFLRQTYTHAFWTYIPPSLYTYDIKISNPRIVIRLIRQFNTSIYRPQGKLDFFFKLTISEKLSLVAEWHIFSQQFLVNPDQKYHQNITWKHYHSKSICYYFISTLRAWSLKDHQTVNCSFRDSVSWLNIHWYSDDVILLGFNTYTW